MTKKEVLLHLIDNLYEGLLMAQINLKFVEERNEELKDASTFEFQAMKSNILRDIDGKMRQVSIAKEMLNNIDE